jgi:phage terminase small subunit
MSTIKQQRALDELAENGGNVSRAMIDAGYSEATAKTPQKLTESVGWKELMDQHLPDDKLARKHDQLLNDEESTVQIKALDMAYKLKGSYAPEKSVTVQLKGEVKDMDKFKSLRNKYEEELRNNIIND